MGLPTLHRAVAGVALLRTINALPLTAAQDEGYEETVPERWGTQAGSPFPRIEGLDGLRTLSAAGGAALVLDAAGASTALGSSAGVPELWHWKRPQPPALQPVAAGAGACTASIAGDEAAGSVLVSPGHGVQLVRCAAGAGTPRCAVVSTLAPASPQLVEGVDGCAAA